MPKTKLLTLAVLCAALINTQQASAQTTKAKATSSKQSTAKQLSANKTTGKKDPVQVTAKQYSAHVSTKQSSAHKSPIQQVLPKQVAVKQVPTTKTVATEQTSNHTTTIKHSPATATTRLKQTPSPQTIAKLEESSANTAVNLLKEKEAVTTVIRENNTPYSPKVIDVTDQTIRLGGGKKEELMFGFAAGDKIIFNFEETDSKELKEIEIIEYPTLSRFSDYKTSRVKNKEIMVTQQAVFIFRLKNSSLVKRICKVKIQRIPASAASEIFNSSVSWITKQDTVWNSYTENVTIGYDTSYVPRTKRVMVRSEIEEQIISDNIQRISSQQKPENRASVVLSLPVDNRAPYKTSRVISWAYWIGVGEEGSRAWQQNVRNVRSKNMDYYTPLGAYSHGSLPYLALPKSGQQINYFIADQNNRDLFMQKQPFRFIDDGKGYGNYRKFTSAGQCQGAYYLCVENANLLGFIDVHVKVTALVEKIYFEDQAYDEMVVTPVTEKQIKQQPFIRNTNLPVTGM